MEDLEEKIQMFKTTLEIEYTYCVQNHLETEAKTIKYLIEEWNEIFS